MTDKCQCTSVKDIYLPEMATIKKVETLTGMETLFDIALDSGEELGHMPGQFAEISLPGIGEAPISVSSSPTTKGMFQMGIRKVGNLTNHLHNLKAGDKVGIRGPFGTSFPVDTAMKGKDLVFVAGGIGLVPLRSAINYVLANRDDYGYIYILFGTKTPADRLYVEELDEWRNRHDLTFMETVDKGDTDWKGNQGVITTLMRPAVGIDPKSTVQVGMDISGEMPGLDLKPDNTVALVCGPPIMYKSVLIELKKLGVPFENVYISLERLMKCGVGKCGHCQINGLYACQDGAVMKYSDVIDVKEAI